MSDHLFQYAKTGDGLKAWYAWTRKQGDRIIVVIDDDVSFVDHETRDPGTGWPSEEMVFNDRIPSHAHGLYAIFRYARGWSDTRAVGYFCLPGAVDQIDGLCQQVNAWIHGLTVVNPRIFFILDVWYGSPGTELKMGLEVRSRLLTAFPDARYMFLSQAGWEFTPKDLSTLVMTKVDIHRPARQGDPCPHKLADFLEVGTPLDPVAWYLAPPRLEAHRDGAVQWFETSNSKIHDYHEPCTRRGQCHNCGYCLHFDTVVKRFPSWNDDRSVKALMMACNWSATRLPYAIAVGWYHARLTCLQDFFGADMEVKNLTSHAKITFPTRPGLPFLLAAQQFFTVARAGYSTPVVLSRVETDLNEGGAVLFLGIRPSGSDWPLFAAFWEKAAERMIRPDWGRQFVDSPAPKNWQDAVERLIGSEVRNRGRGSAFLHAAEAWPARDETVVKGKPLAAVFAGVREAAVPWRSEGLIGLSWHASVE